MNTPIVDFVRRYAEKGTLRLHMPGHKGIGSLGMEQLDLTEIKGADALFTSDGIIAESERNASNLFGAHTFYSTEGASLAIRAMLYLAMLHAKSIGKAPKILAGRNAHGAFLSGCALLDLPVAFLSSDGSYLSASPSEDVLAARIEEERPSAVYLTNPDYLGHIADIASLARVCHERDVLLLVDNAHGAYLRFLSPSRHPIDLGADMTADSAHKTLPTLTGGAYLHVSENAPTLLHSCAKSAMSLFASTSPSYLILQSLDETNACLAEHFSSDLSSLAEKACALRNRCEEMGIQTVGDEPIKLTLSPKSYGYTGYELAEHFRAYGIECELADPDFTVLMLSPSLPSDFDTRVYTALAALAHRAPLTGTPPLPFCGKRVCSLREASLAPSIEIPSCEALGRVLAYCTLACPPAVPIALPGEMLTEQSLSMLDYYGVRTVRVLAD